MNSIAEIIAVKALELVEMQDQGATENEIIERVYSWFPKEQRAAVERAWLESPTRTILMYIRNLPPMGANFLHQFMSEQLNPRNVDRFRENAGAGEGGARPTLGLDHHDHTLPIGGDVLSRVLGHILMGGSVQ